MSLNDVMARLGTSSRTQKLKAHLDGPSSSGQTICGMVRESNKTADPASAR